MAKANDRQVGGDHYKGDSQHWDWAWKNELDYFQGQITKYVARWRDKNGLQDLEKAQHFLEKYIELVKAETKIPVGLRLNDCTLGPRTDCSCGHEGHGKDCPLWGAEPDSNYVDQDRDSRGKTPQ